MHNIVFFFPPSVGGFLRTWVPFLLPLSAVVLICLLLWTWLLNKLLNVTCIMTSCNRKTCLTRILHQAVSLWGINCLQSVLARKSLSCRIQRVPTRQQELRVKWQQIFAKQYVDLSTTLDLAHQNALSSVTWCWKYKCWILYNHSQSTCISWNFGVHCISRQMCYLLWEIYLLVQLLSFTHLQLYTMSA